VKAHAGPTAASRPRRRAVLVGFAAAAVAPFAAGGWFDERPVESLGSFLARCFTHPDTAAWLGESYLSAAPAEKDQATLERAVFGDMTLVSLSAMTQAVAERVAADFRTADMVAVHGWILARTEARLCALASLADLA